jgi:hypothetical protein
MRELSLVELREVSGGDAPVDGVAQLKPQLTNSQGSGVGVANSQFTQNGQHVSDVATSAPGARADDVHSFL